MKIAILTSWALTSLTKLPIKQLLPLLLPVVNGFLQSQARNNRWLSLTMTRRAGTTADDTTLNSIIETIGMNHNDDKSRSLRRKIPFVETFEEQIVRELWEINPFDGAKYVIDTVIRSDSSSISNSNNNNKNIKYERSKKNLHPGILIPKTSSSPLLMSGYENLFDPLYKRDSGRENDNETYTDNGYKIITEPSTSIDTPPITISNTQNNNKIIVKDKKKHFCLRVAYRGDYFCGWQTQLNNLDKPSVQQTLEDLLTILQNEQQLDKSDNSKRRFRGEGRREERDGTNSIIRGGSKNNSNYVSTTKSKHNGDGAKYRLKRANLPVSGRTDSGVNAVGQICRFRTSNNYLTPEIIEQYLSYQIMLTSKSTTPNNDLSRSLRVTDITEVSRAFHPTFSTSCRAYAYLIDIDGNNSNENKNTHSNDPSSSSFLNNTFSRRNNKFRLVTEERAVRQVAILNNILRKLEGESLDYIGLSYGKVKTTSTICTLHHARARLVQYDDGSRMVRTAVCIELVGNRFLRRMVRLLVEASMRLVAKADADGATKLGDSNRTTIAMTPKDDALFNLISGQDRTLVGRPAPPDGLIFVGAKLESI